QEALPDVPFEVDADGAHVAGNLGRRLLEGEVDRLFAPLAGGVDEGGGHAALAGPRRAGDQHAAAPVVPLAAEHGVEPLQPGGDPLAAGLVIQTDRGDGQDVHAPLVDQAGGLVAPVAPPPV